MTIDEAIKQEYATYELHKLDAKEYHDAAISKLNPFEKSLLEEQEEKNIKTSQEHRQLAEWLKELQAHREAWMKVVSEVDQHTDIHSDGEFYIKNFDVKKIIAEYRPKEGDAE